LYILKCPVSSTVLAWYSPLNEQANQCGWVDYMDGYGLYGDGYGLYGWIIWIGLV